MTIHFAALKKIPQNIAAIYRSTELVRPLFGSFWEIFLRGILSSGPGAFWGSTFTFSWYSLWLSLNSLGTLSGSLGALFRALGALFALSWAPTGVKN